MKRTLLTITAILLMCSAQAQEGDKIIDLKATHDKTINGADLTDTQKDTVLTVSTEAIPEAVKESAFNDSIFLASLAALPGVGDTVNYGTLYMKPRARVDSISIPYDVRKYVLYKDKKGNIVKQDTIWVKQVRKVKVDRIELRIEGFHIMRCAVYTNLGMFQSRYPISLLYYNQSRYKNKWPRKTDRLYLQKEEGRTWSIRIGDVLGFDPSARHRVSLTDYDISLKTDSPRYAIPLLGVPVADNIINLSVFTDIAGLFGAANGLVQFEADAYIPINHSNMSNTNWFFMRTLRPYFDLSRLDKEFQVTDLSKELDDHKVNDTTVPQMFRKAFMRGGLELNFFNCVAGTNNYNFFAGGEFRQARIRLAADDVRSANMISAYVGATFYTRALDNFRIGAESRYYFASHLIQTIQYNREHMHWLNTGVSISYHPPSNPSSKIFLRFTYNLYLKEPGNDFVQVQIGYKTPLSRHVKTTAE